MPEVVRSKVKKDGIAWLRRRLLVLHAHEGTKAPESHLPVSVQPSFAISYRSALVL